MIRKTIDCRTAPNDVGCTLAISGEPDEHVAASAQHAVTVHGHADAPELREQMRGLLADEPSVSAPGAFVQLIEFDTDRIGEWDAIVSRWAEAIGAQHTVRWAVLGSDRDRPGRHVAIVAFGGYTEAMANSRHPATQALGKELQAICTGEPRFRNLDVGSTQTY